MNEASARRPLKSRDTTWAQALSRGLLKTGLHPNQVSLLSIVFAAAAAGFLICPAPPVWWHWLAAALCIQLRLLCNLMDGMLAVEGGLKTPNGELYNEFPDRLADLIILAGLGLADGTLASERLGWLCAGGAIMTAAVRLHGAALTGSHDFRGPMAKPHRMALATAACLLQTVLLLSGSAPQPLTWLLAVMLAGISLTLARRLRNLSRTLRSRHP
jgi:phosphatidylglycerophosphate synthase